jgi:hypothetical protein
MKREDEAVGWNSIEGNYLREYGSFVRAGFDRMADGLWETPSPARSAWA